jgi:hypothetical protein
MRRRIKKIMPRKITFRIRKKKPMTPTVIKSSVLMMTPVM